MGRATIIIALTILAVLIVLVAVFGFFRINDFDFFKAYVDMDYWNHRIDIVILLLVAIFLLLLAILVKINPFA